jgi:hypothetical protein
VIHTRLGVISFASATVARHSRRKARTSARNANISLVYLPWRQALRLPLGAPPRGPETGGEGVCEIFEFNRRKSGLTHRPALEIVLGASTALRQPERTRWRAPQTTFVLTRSLITIIWCDGGGDQET